MPDQLKNKKAMKSPIQILTTWNKKQEARQQLLSDSNRDTLKSVINKKPECELLILNQVLLLKPNV